MYYVVYANYYGCAPAYYDAYETRERAEVCASCLRSAGMEAEVREVEE